MTFPMKNPIQRGGADGVQGAHSNNLRQVNFNPVETIIQRMDGVKPEGKGYRARCPACGGQSRKLTVVEGDDGRALIHCFGCNDTRAVLDAIGLKWRDIYPVRHWPESPEEKRKASRAMREAGWRSALCVLDYETVIVCIVYCQIMDGRPLSLEVYNRLFLAGKRITNAWEALR